MVTQFTPHSALSSRLAAMFKGSQAPVAKDAALEASAAAEDSAQSIEAAHWASVQIAGLSIPPPAVTSAEASMRAAIDIYSRTGDFSPLGKLLLQPDQESKPTVGSTLADQKQESAEASMRAAINLYVRTGDSSALGEFFPKFKPTAWSTLAGSNPDVSLALKIAIEDNQLEAAKIVLPLVPLETKLSVLKEAGKDGRTDIFEATLQLIPASELEMLWDDSKLFTKLCQDLFATSLPPAAEMPRPSQRKSTGPR